MKIGALFTPLIIPYTFFRFCYKALIAVALERFSNYFGKINSKVITPTNQNRSEQRDEPIRISKLL